MKPRIVLALATLLATGALAQAPSPAPAINPPANLVSEPTASASASEGPNAEIANPIVQALNAEASLKGSKLTVVPDGGVVMLTGVTVTREQMKRAMEIATAQVGEGKVGNAIQTQELVVVSDPVTTAEATSQADTAIAATEPTATEAAATTEAASAPANPSEAPTAPATASEAAGAPAKAVATPSG